MQPKTSRIARIGLLVALILAAGARVAYADAGAGDSLGLASVNLLKGQGHYGWAQVQIGGSIYDPDDAVPVLRGSLGAQVGRRFGKFGAFFNINLNRTFKGSHEADKIRYTQVGPGFEYLTPSGFIRSSISAGLTILGSDFEGETAGKRGWYAEWRPLSVRWDAAGHIVELSPIVFELARPVESDSVTIFDHYIKLAYEW